MRLLVTVRLLVAIRLLVAVRLVPMRLLSSDAHHSLTRPSLVAVLIRRNFAVTTSISETFRVLLY